MDNVNTAHQVIRENGKTRENGREREMKKGE